MKKRNRMEVAEVVTGESHWAPKPTGLAKNDRRRRFIRWQVDVPVRELGPEGHIMRGTSVSAGGVFCPDVPPRLRGARMVVEIDLLGRNVPIVCCAQVVYAGTAPDGLGIGLAFDQPQYGLAEYLATVPSLGSTDTVART